MSRILRASAVSAAATLIARVAGAVRDVAVANVFGAQMASDAFWVAFSVPGVFRRFVADEGLSGALIPAVTRAEKEDGTGAAKLLSGGTLALLLLSGALLTLLGIVFAPQLVTVFGYGFTRNHAQFELAVSLTRWMFPFVITVSLVSYCEGLLNHRGHFFWPKLAPAVVSGAIAVSALWLTDAFAEPAMALAAGVLVGGVLHLLLCVPPLLRHWGWPTVSLAVFRTPRFRTFVREMGKVVAIGVFAQINIVVLRTLASLLEPGSVTRYWYANRLIDLTQGAIAVGVGSALLPEIAKAAANSDWSRFRTDLSHAVRLVALVLVPVSCGILVVARPMVSVLFLHGQFTVRDAEITAEVLRAMVPFMLAVAGLNIVRRAFFALDDRNTLFWVGAAGAVFTAALGWFLATELGVVGLALALSLSTVLQLAVYVALLRKKLPEGLALRALVAPLGKMLVAALPAAGLAAVLCWPGAWDLGPSSMRNLVLFGAAAVLAAAAYAAVGTWLGIAELRELSGRLRARFGR